MNIFLKILITLIKGYKYFISPIFGQSCRFLPTCSEYSIEALKEFGLIKGIFMSIKRILSCHPIKFLGGNEGFDPVKKEIKIKK
jgi:putative membrane protein insertion efficiency factor